MVVRSLVHDASQKVASKSIGSVGFLWPKVSVYWKCPEESQLGTLISGRENTSIITGKEYNAWKLSIGTQFLYFLLECTHSYIFWRCGCGVA